MTLVKHHHLIDLYRRAWQTGRVSEKEQPQATLGAELRSIRETKGVSLRAMERASGINSGYLSQLERGEIANPTPSVLQKVAKAYDQPMGLLMRWAGYVEDGLSPNAQRALSVLGDDLSSDEVQALKAVLDVLRSKGSASFSPLQHRTDLVLDMDDHRTVRGAALGVLRELDALDTPVAVDLDAATLVAKLVSVGAIELDTHDKRKLRERFGDLADRALSALQGVVHLDRNEVFLNPTLHASRRRFVLGHEIGHAVLEDHRITFAHLDDLTRLAPDFHDRLERQANQFSIELLAKGDLLRDDFDSSSPSVKRFEELADRYGISLQAAARRLAEESRHPCAMAVAYRGQEGAGSLLVDRHKIWSSKAFEERLRWNALGRPQAAIEERLRSAALGVELEALEAEDADGRRITIELEGKNSPFATFVLMRCPPAPKPTIRRLRRRVNS
ncbi:helix-turn-helix domain-containing protein [Patulibacter defluvii]|uniref:helix-turn-helix domain-containing protein n=1 Tax=Patulibacter defluvii TaxID=3095358 RepID=UPI002A75D3DD|nr:XRE family transcriptional regulator [Patulibacter sp. DM4]